MSHKAEVIRVSTTNEIEDIFKDDDFPNFLVDFRRGLASAAAAATRKIPRVIGSKVTKLGAGKPLTKAANEWTDVTSDDVKDERKNQVEAALPTTTSAWPSTWGNAAARSFAETLKMAAKPTAAPVPTKTDVAKPTEDVENAKKKKKRKKKKKAKSEETASEVPQQTKKSKAPLMLDLSVLVPKK